MHGNVPARFLRRKGVPIIQVKASFPNGRGRAVDSGMSADSSRSSATIESGGGGAGQPTSRWKPARSTIISILVAVIVGSSLGMSGLAFSFPCLPDRLVGVYFVCLLALLAFFLGTLFRRRWDEVPIFLAIWAVVLFPIYGDRAPLRWLYVEAFRIHASPIEEYLSRCKLIEFVESGVKQVLGRCEGLGIGGEAVLEVFYDTTGQFVLPVSQRTPEWKAAMWHVSPHAVLIDEEGRAQKLFGNFYEITIFSSESDG
jgi:hypothetical protein